METVDINENNVNDKTDRSGKGLSCIDTTIEIILGERSLQVPENVFFCLKSISHSIWFKHKIQENLKLSMYSAKIKR